MFVKSIARFPLRDGALSAVDRKILCLARFVGHLKNGLYTILAALKAAYGCGQRRRRTVYSLGSCASYGFPRPKSYVLLQGLCDNDFIRTKIAVFIRTCAYSRATRYPQLARSVYSPTAKVDASAKAVTQQTSAITTAAIKDKALFIFLPSFLL